MWVFLEIYKEILLNGQSTAAQTQTQRSSITEGSGERGVPSKRAVGNS